MDHFPNFWGEYSKNIWVFPTIFGTPKWMVKIMVPKPSEQMGLIWGYHYSWKHPVTSMGEGFFGTRKMVAQ